MDNGSIRLDKSEIEKLRARLADWQTPSAMLDVYDAIVERIGSVTLFNQAGLAFIRDAWIGAEFGAQRRAEKVRLVSATWPDFELLINGHVEPFEAVEADEPGRRRGLEYQQDDGEVELDPIENWIARAEAAAIWIEAACRKKVAKRYGARTNLVVYLNMNEFDVRKSEVEACFASATEVAKNVFESVWVLWKARVYRVWG